jgi:hypothetical protein
MTPYPNSIGNTYSMAFKTLLLKRAAVNVIKSIFRFDIKPEITLVA